jgi:hypothetical protein
VIKTSNQCFGLRCTNPNAESKKYGKTGKLMPPKVNIFKKMDIHNNELDEVQRNQKNDYKNDQ